MQRKTLILACRTAPAIIFISVLILALSFVTPTAAQTSQSRHGCHGKPGCHVRLSSIAIAPANQSIQTGQNITFHATGTFTDGSTEDLTAPPTTWTAFPPNIVSLDFTA
jgi:hypothetical protein